MAPSLLSNAAATPSSTPAAAPAPAPSLREGCALAARTVRAGGCVLCPCCATGDAWPLLEALLRALDDANQGHVRVMYVGAAAVSSLAFASTCPEFVCRWVRVCRSCLCVGTGWEGIVGGKLCRVGHCGK